MTSENKIESNRQNALKSTGPEDTEKTRVNAFRHGLRSEKCFRKEDLEWINSTQERLEQDFTPIDIVQEFLVHRMAISMWKLNKVVEDTQCRYRTKHLKAKGDKMDELLKSLDPYYEDEKKEIAKANIPEYDDIDEQDELFLRYEVSAENSFYKALDKLREIKKEGG